MVSFHLLYILNYIWVLAFDSVKYNSLVFNLKLDWMKKVLSWQAHGIKMANIGKILTSTNPIY